MNPVLQKTAGQTKAEGNVGRIFSLGLLLLLSLGIGVATAADTEALKEQLNKSLKTWEDLKGKCGGNYSYKVKWSNHLGFGHETVLVVRNNQVVERKFTQWKSSPTTNAPAKEIGKASADTWTERDAEVGSHKKGAAGKTLDQLYRDADKLLKVKLKPYHSLTVQMDKQGLLQACYFIDTRLPADPPHTGVEIDNLTLEMPK